jgi:hypothetical protein
MPCASFAPGWARKSPSRRRNSRVKGSHLVRSTQARSACAGHKRAEQPPPTFYEPDSAHLTFSVLYPMRSSARRRFPPFSLADQRGSG